MDFQQILMYIVYFLVGGLLDILSVIDLKAVQHNKALKSATVTTISTIISYVIFYMIIQSPEALSEILFYALGGGVGAYIIIKKGYYGKVSQEEKDKER